MYTALLVARTLTTKVSYVPGSDVVLEAIRKWGSKFSGTIVINDFDGDLKFEMSLAGSVDSRVFWYGARAQPVLSLLHRIVKPGHTVLDVGAGAGEIALFTAKRVGAEGRVVAVEAKDDSADRLTRNLALNHFEHVDVLRMGLGREVRQAEGAEPAASSLDALLDEGWFSQVDVLKLGEGHATLAVLEGGRHTLESFQPFVLLAGGEDSEVTRLLTELRYRFYLVDRESNLVQFHGRPPYAWAVAVPPGKSPG